MKRFINSYSIFQILFFGVTTFLLHFALFEFWRYDGELFWKVFNNWFPLLIIDLFVGLVIGLMVGVGALIFRKDGQDLIIPIIVTDILWLGFCILSFNLFRDPDGREPAAHIISPMFAGFIGLILALANLNYFPLLNRITKNDNYK